MGAPPSKTKKNAYFKGYNDQYSAEIVMKLTNWMGLENMGEWRMRERSEELRRTGVWTNTKKVFIINLSWYMAENTIAIWLKL